MNIKKDLPFIGVGVVVILRVLVAWVVVAWVEEAALVLGICVVDARMVEVPNGTLLHDALNPVSLTLLSDLNFMNRELSDERIGAMMLLAQNLLIREENSLLPSLTSTKS